MIWAAERKMKEDPEAALTIIQKVLGDEPNNAEAQKLLTDAEEQFVNHIFNTTTLSPQSIPKLLISPTSLTNTKMDPQEGFVLSRINGSWDIQSILSICPFRDADCLRMIKDLIDRGIVGL